MQVDDEEQAIHELARQASESHFEANLDSTTMSLTIPWPEGPEIQHQYTPSGQPDYTKRWTKVNAVISSSNPPLHRVPLSFVSLYDWRMKQLFWRYFPSWIFNFFKLFVVTRFCSWSRAYRIPPPAQCSAILCQLSIFWLCDWRWCRYCCLIGGDDASRLASVRISNEQCPAPPAPPTDDEFWLPGRTKPHAAFIRRHFFHEGRLLPHQAMWILREATKILRTEPNVLSVTSPVTSTFSASLQILPFTLLWFNSLWRYTWTICKRRGGRWNGTDLDPQYDLVRLMEPGLGGSASKTTYLFLGKYNYPVWEEPRAKRYEQAIMWTVESSALR